MFFSAEGKRNYLWASLRIFFEAGPSLNSKSITGHVVNKFHP